MIASHDGRMDLGALDLGPQLRRYQHIVDSPSDIARPRIGKVAPPGIVPIALREHAEGIDEARVDEGLESRAFFVGKSFLAAILFRVGKIQFRVRDVEVAAKYH